MTPQLSLISITFKVIKIIYKPNNHLNLRLITRNAERDIKQSLSLIYDSDLPFVSRALEVCVCVFLAFRLCTTSIFDNMAIFIALLTETICSCL